MNIIHQLFDIDYVHQLFKEKVLPQYPDFSSIKKIEMNPRKDHIWDQTYHVVIEYKTHFIDKNGKTRKLSIFCSAHSCEPRKNLYSALKYLWDNGFGYSMLTVPHPLFYSQKFKATFYRGAKGRNFYYFIKNNKLSDIEKTIGQIAAWFAKLHRTNTDGIGNFNKKNSRIRTAIPGKEKILKLIGDKYPHYYSVYKNLYNVFVRQEEEFLKKSGKRWLVHGDAHPENIIKAGEKKLAVIDFNDLCLSDHARDVGCFLQQFGFMASRKIEDKVFVDHMKSFFLESYLSAMKMELTDELESRINNYSDWTALRTATFFLLKNDPDPQKAKPLIDGLTK